eukprot:16444676-Heterocapsa_arctica.AAC.1
MSSLRAKWMATAPSLVMVRREVPVKEFTTWELCDYLLSDDWTLYPLPAAGKGHLRVPLVLSLTVELTCESK